jgi:hypothetical protein
VGAGEVRLILVKAAAREFEALNSFIPAAKVHAGRLSWH